MCGGGGWTVEGEGSGAQNRKFPGGRSFLGGARSANFGGFPKKTDHFGMPGGGARPRPPPFLCL